MKNVLHTIHVTGPGGAETVCLDLARGLNGGGWRSFVTIPEAGWIHQPLVEAGIEPILLPTSSRSGYLRGVLNIVRKHRIDLIQAHLLGPSVNASLAGMIAGVPVVSTFHGHSDIRLDGPVRDAVRHRVVRNGSRKVVCVSESLRRSYVDRGYNRPERTAVVVNGIDTERFRPRRDRSLRRELGFSDEHVLVGTIANLRPAKDYPTFLRAAALLSARSPQYRFVAVGDNRGALYGELLSMRDSLGLTDKVAFIGFREDSDRILNNLDAFLVTSRTEGFSLATVQAMASGIPIVATRCGGTEDILENERTGLLVGVGAAREIANGVERLLRDDDLRRRMIACSQVSAERRFSTAEMIRQYEEIYQRLLMLGGSEHSMPKLVPTR